MLTAELKEVKGRAFGRSGGAAPKGSRRYVELSDGSVVKWWGGKWYRKWKRWDRAVATSLTTRALTIADENGRFREEREEFEDCGKFLVRLNALVGTYEALRIIAWITRVEM